MTPTTDETPQVPENAGGDSNVKTLKSAFIRWADVTLGVGELCLEPVEAIGVLPEPDPPTPAELFKISIADDLRRTRFEFTVEIGSKPNADDIDQFMKLLRASPDHSERAWAWSWRRSPRKIKQQRVREAIDRWAQHRMVGRSRRRRAGALARLHAVTADLEPIDVEAELREIRGYDADEDDCDHTTNGVPAIVFHEHDEYGSSWGRCANCGEEGFPIVDVPYNAACIANGGGMNGPRRTNGTARNRRLQQQRWMQEARRYLAAAKRCPPKPLDAGADGA